MYNNEYVVKWAMLPPRRRRKGKIFFLLFIQFMEKYGRHIFHFVVTDYPLIFVSNTHSCEEL